MPIAIREATQADLPSLEVIRKQAMEAGFTDRYRRADFADLIASPDERVRDWIAATDVLVLLAETDVTPVGFGAYDASAGRVLALYTAPEYQREGCASALLERFERRARIDGTDELHATVPLNAVGFFERRGFDRRRTTERHGLEMVACVKPLS